MTMKFAGKCQARHLSFALVVMLLGAVVCNASITYNVNRTIGAGSVTGFIQTDGTTPGPLFAGNILNWDLTLTDPSATFNINGGNSVVYIQGADVTASTTQLLFNFSGSDNGILLFQQGLFSGNHYYCAATQLGACLQGETVTPISVFSSYQNVGRSGNVVIGAVPEPGTLLLMGSSLIGAIGTLRRKLL